MGVGRRGAQIRDRRFRCVGVRHLQFKLADFVVSVSLKQAVSIELLDVG